MRTARLVRAAAAAALAASMTSCGLPSLHVLPAPKPVPGKTYKISAVFTDALNVSEGAKVKQAGIVIGDVTDVSTHDYHAVVRMRISTKISLLPGTTAQIRFTSPLGEDYVALIEPTQPGSGPPLAAGATIPQSRTSSAPTIEDTFAALSLLLNGGGLNQLGTIVREVNRALGGRAGAVRDTLSRLNQVVRSLDAHKADIDVVISSLARISNQLSAERGVVGQALETFPPAVQVLADQLSRLDDLVVRVGKLGDRMQSVIARSQDALLADLDALRPTIEALASTRDSLPSTMQSLIRFGKLIDRAAPGDYLNSVATINVLFGTQPAPLQTIPPSSSTVATMQSLLAAGAGGTR
ncbi:MAG TPA: MlaD family protein [Jatrophihabitantaceae bacterium]|nr:MlaD family protein [Jatrophihabitantaceae bacterium]